MEEQQTRRRTRKSTKPTLIHVNLRLPLKVLDYYKQYPNYTAKMRSVLTEHAQKEAAEEN